MKKLFKEFTSAQLAKLKKEYDPLKGKTLSTDQWKRMEAMLAKYPTPMLVKIANADIPMLATAAKSELVIKRKTHKWSDFRRPMDMGESLQVMEEITEACWVGYKQVGMKDKGGRQVPNCVPDPDNKISKQKKEKVNEVDLSKAQIKQAHDKADDLPKKDFIKRYGKDGDAVRFATATNMVKKKLGIGEEVELEEANFVFTYTDPTSPFGASKRQGKLIVAKDKNTATKEFKKMKPKATIKDVEEVDNMYGHESVEVELEEGRMKELHTLIQQGKSAEEISKIMGVDVKTIKSLMPKEDVEEDRAPGPITNPDVATALRQYAAQRPLEFKKSAGNFPYKEGDKKANFDILQDLALKDMKQFNIKFKAMDNDSKDHVKKALAKKGLSSTLVNDNKPKGDQTMNESYKDKFNATMKKFGINSLDDLKSDEDKKKFFKAVDNAHVAKNEVKEDHDCAKVHPDNSHEEWEKSQSENVEEAFTKKDFKANERDNEHGENAKIVVGLFGTPQDVAVIDAINARHKKQRYISKEDQKKRDAIVNKYYKKLKEEVTKTGDDDLAPDALKLNAMVKDPHKSKGDNPKKDLNATYMKSDVRADVKNGGGADMSKVNDKPKIQAALKKISASYESRKYHDTKPGSIQDAIMQMQMDEYKMITVEDKKLDGMIKTYLSKGGTITKLPPALQKGAKPSDMKKHKIGDKGVVKSHMYKMKEVREFITTYNSHFLTNYKAEEFILKDRLDEAMNISTVKKEIQKIYDTAKKDGYLGLKGHDDFKDLLQQTDTKKLYPKMHELGTFLSSATTGIFKTPSSAKSGALGKELVKLSYKIS